MVLGRRSQVTRGGILAVQAALLLIAITAFAMRDGLGVMTWLFAGVALAGLIVLGFARSPDSEHEEADEAEVRSAEAPPRPGLEAHLHGGARALANRVFQHLLGDMEGGLGAYDDPDHSASSRATSSTSATRSRGSLPLSTSSCRSTLW